MRLLAFVVVALKLLLLLLLLMRRWWLVAILIECLEHHDVDITLPVVAAKHDAP
jgi:hypothetical protein